MDVKEGENFYLNFTSSGFPNNIRYTWNHNAIPISTLSPALMTFDPSEYEKREGGLYVRRTDNVDTQQHEMVSEGSILMVNQVRASDAGEIQVSAENSQGLSTVTLTLNVLCEYN